MFSKNNSSVTIDLLFNLLLTFVCLFFLSFLLVNSPSEDKDSDIESGATYIITRSYTVRNGTTTFIHPNEEIMTMRGVLEGEYSLSAHYFGGRDLALEVVATFVIQDVERKHSL